MMLSFSVICLRFGILTLKGRLMALWKHVEARMSG
ncbi:unnamed protein product [Linum tenue]|uniref:Uncharacterized protein n=1 Tax=Linum tenue TaxID=586396 RepID=A0AAV0HNT2_9ROSI|nr:unnamed protein product [Linum tenue]